jgi:hypothetical protein
MTDSDRDLLAHAYTDYTAAVKAARALWSGAGESTLREAAADFLVHVRELRRSGGSVTAPVSAPTVVGSLDNPSFPTCPTCHGPTVAASRKTARSPHYRCANRQCDTPIWTDRKKNGTHP